MKKGVYTMNTTLYKYKSLDSSYFILDPKKNSFPITKGFVQEACDKAFSIGADGIIRGPFFMKQKVKMELFGHDGIEQKVTDNSIRAFAMYLYDAGYIEDSHIIIDTNSGQYEAEYINPVNGFVKVTSKDIIFPQDNFASVKALVPSSNQSALYKDRLFNAVCLENNPKSSILMLEETGRNEITSFQVKTPSLVEDGTCMISSSDAHLTSVKSYLAGVLAYRMGLVHSHLEVVTCHGSIFIEMNHGEINSIAAAKKSGLLMMEYHHRGFVSNTSCS
jgi:hypothetical protein